MKRFIVASKAEAKEIGSVRPLGDWLPVTTLFVAFGGLFAAAVLSAGHILKLPVPCGTSSGCATVASHPSSMFLGVPIAFFGVAAYVAIIFLLKSVVWTRWASPALVAITGAGTLVSAGLLIYAHVVIAPPDMVPRFWSSDGDAVSPDVVFVAHSRRAKTGPAWPALAPGNHHCSRHWRGRMVHGA